MNDIRPILSALARHKSAAAILLLEVALTCAILCNALYLIQQRVQAVNVRSGVDEAHLLHIQLSGIGQRDDALAQTRTDLAALRALPGVANATLITQLPMINSSWNSTMGPTPDEVSQTINSTLYMGEDGMLDTLGLKLVAGRAFNADDFITVADESAFSNAQPSTAIVTRALGEKLHPGQNAIGKVFYMGTPKPVTIIGVVERLIRPANGLTGEQTQYSTLLPLRQPYTMAGRYAIRTRPGSDQHGVLNAAVAELKRINPRRVFLDQQTFAEIREDHFAQDRSMVWLLSAVSVILLAVTAFGIVGLASFWVQQRNKQIGVRRALGATRGNILRHFQTENFLIVTGGIVLGMLLAFGINQWLMGKYELPRLPWFYLPIGALVLWGLGQLAVLWPALRAASIPPATATRSA